MHGKLHVRTSAARGLLLPMVLGALLGTGCGPSLRQVQDRMDHSDIALQATDLEGYGIGFLTPAAATGREADKQALALAFSRILQEVRPELRVVPLPGVLSALNAADMDQQYKQMYRDYLETGILDGALLNRIGKICGVRYLAQLSLASFEQTNRGRLGILGLRMVETKTANIRVFIQLWDSETGAVAWEGGGELNYAYDTAAEKPVTFQTIAEAAATRLYADLPRSDKPAPPAADSAPARRTNGG